MNSGISQYPYLIVVAVFCIVLLYCFLRAGTHRNTLLLTGILSVPGSCLSFVFVPEYWYPVRLIEANPGIEDILFSFATGAFVWFLSLRKQPHDQFTFRLNWKVGAKRFLETGAIGAVTFALVTRFDSLSVMSHMLITMFITSLLIKRHYKGLVNIAISNSIVFGAIYTICIVTAFHVFPDFSAQWNWDRLWGTSFLSVPMEEIVWAFAFGFTWSLILFYVLDAKQRKSLLVS